MDNESKAKFTEELFEYMIDNGEKTLTEVFSSSSIDFLKWLKETDLEKLSISEPTPAPIIIQQPVYTTFERTSSKFTKLGVKILKFLQQEENKLRHMTAAEIGKGLSIQTCSVSGAMKKLINDGYIGKGTGASPYKYYITEKGLNETIEE